MKNLIVFSVTIFLFACGGGSSKPAQEPAPAATTAGADVNATAKVEAKVETPPAPVAPPVVAKVPPKIVLGAEAKISMKLDFDKEGKAESDIVIAADGKATAKLVQILGKKKTPKKATALKVTQEGEVQDDKGKAVAKMNAEGSVSVMQETEYRENNKVVKTETNWNDVGTIDAEGVFTSAKDGTKVSIGADGTVTGFPADMQVKVTATPEQRPAVMLLLITSLAGAKVTLNSGPATSGPAPTPVKK